MRQSLSENRSTYIHPPEPTTRNWRAAARAVLLAIVLSAVLVVVAIIDQTGGRSLANHVTTMYAPYGKRPDPSLLYGLVYAVAAIGALLWLLALRVVQSRGRSAPILTVVVTMVTAALALLLLVSSEYGAQIFPPLWGILGVLPPAAGILAAVLLRRRGGRKVLRLQSGQRAHVRDVVLGHRSPEHRGALLVGRAAAPERLDGRPRPPALEYVPATITICCPSAECGPAIAENDHRSRSNSSVWAPEMIPEAAQDVEVGHDRGLRLRPRAQVCQ